MDDFNIKITSNIKKSKIVNQGTMNMNGAQLNNMSLYNEGSAELENVVTNSTIYNKGFIKGKNILIFLIRPIPITVIIFVALLVLFMFLFKQ